MLRDSVALGPRISKISQKGARYCQGQQAPWIERGRVPTDSCLVSLSARYGLHRFAFSDFRFYALLFICPYLLRVFCKMRSYLRVRSRRHGVWWKSTSAQDQQSRHYGWWESRQPTPLRRPTATPIRYSPTAPHRPMHRPELRGAAEGEPPGIAYSGVTCGLHQTMLHAPGDSRRKTTPLALLSVYSGTVAGGKGLHRHRSHSQLAAGCLLFLLFTLYSCPN